MSLAEDNVATNLAGPEPPVAALALQPHETVLQAVRRGSEPSSTYWLMNALATVIACYGLLANSAAVVIGAMVVALLLGPISGVALGLNEGDKPLLRIAARSLLGGIA